MGQSFEDQMSMLQEHMDYLEKAHLREIDRLKRELICIHAKLAKVKAFIGKMKFVVTGNQSIRDEARMLFEEIR